MSRGFHFYQSQPLDRVHPPPPPPPPPPPGPPPPPPPPDLFVPLSIRHLTAEWSQSKFRFYLSCVRTLNRKFPNILYFLLVKAALRKQPNLFSTQFSTKQTLCRAPYFFIFTLFFFLEGVRLKALNLTGD